MIFIEKELDSCHKFIFFDVLIKIVAIHVNFRVDIEVVAYLFL